MRIASGHQPVLVRVPITATASIAQGAVLMPGVTADTDIGTYILGTTAIADALGVLAGPYTYSATNTSNPGGTQYVFVDVEIFDSYVPVWCVYDQADSAAVASTSGTTITITSLTADIDGTWLYAVSGTGAGELAWMVSTASGSGVSKTATGWDSTTTVIKILTLGSQLAKINAAATKIGTDAAAGSWTVHIFENWFEAQGYPLQQLNPTLHDNLTLTNPRFYAKFFVRNTAGHTVD
jgi:hypothetical protein